MSLSYVQSNTLYLAGSGVQVGATSATLQTLTDIYGNVLTMASFGAKGYITFEPDTNNEEAGTFTGITANTNGTYTLTGLKTALAQTPYTEISGLVRQHAGGTKVVITDSVAFWNTFPNKQNNEVITGAWTAPTGGTGSQIATATDIANAITGASGTATNTTFGTVKLSVPAATTLNPIVAGDNDPRFSTLSGTAVNATTNKAIDNLSTSTTGSGSLIPKGVAGILDISWIPTGTTANKVVELNSSAQLPAVDGSLLTNVPVANTTHGTTTKNSGDASGTQTIAHGLGRPPKFVTITMVGLSSGTAQGNAKSVYNGTTQSSQSVVPGSTYTLVNTLTIGSATGSQVNTGTLTDDGTNIYVAWVNSGSGSSPVTYQLLWTAQ